jgi:hypothetical protein
MTDTNVPLKDASEAAGAHGIRLVQCCDRIWGAVKHQKNQKIKLTLNKGDNKDSYLVAYQLLWI